MKYKLRHLIISVIALMLLANCGLKGPLYQTPEQPNDTEQQQEQR